MRETLNTTFLFFLALAVIAVSRGITKPETLRAEREEIRQVLARPALRLPTGQAGLPTGQAGLSVGETTDSVGLAAISRLQRNRAIPPPELKSRSVLVETLDGEVTFLARNPYERRPIASITKLITAAVILDHAELNEEVRVSSYAVRTEGDAGGLKPDEFLSVETLLNAMLLESSNDAAVALAEHIGAQTGEGAAGAIRTFVSLMNEKARSLNLADTFFADPVGLRDDTSFSTPTDLAQIVRYLRTAKEYQPIWQILQKESAYFASLSGSTYAFSNNNPFVTERGGVVGGKTGYTDAAGESMVMVVSSPDGETEIIYVVLGSTDRFADMRTLINWVASAFIWEKQLSR